MKSGNRGRAPESLAALHHFKPNDPRRHTGKHTLMAKAKIKAAALAREAAKRVAREHVKSEAVQQKLRRRAEGEALSRIYTDALERLRNAEPEAAEAIVRGLRASKPSDQLAAARELLNRTRGLPVQELRSFSVSAELDDQTAAVLLEKMIRRRLESRDTGTEPGGRRLQPPEVQAESEE